MYVFIHYNVSYINTPNVRIIVRSRVYGRKKKKSIKKTSFDDLHISAYRNVGDATISIAVVETEHVVFSLHTTVYVMDSFEERERIVRAHYSCRSKGRRIARMCARRAALGISRFLADTHILHDTRIGLRRCGASRSQTVFFFFHCENRSYENTRIIIHRAYVHENII